MGHQPHALRVRCPGCMTLDQKPVFKSWLSQLVRLECACGVSGKWVRHYEASGPSIEMATEGWAMAFGYPANPPPRGGSAGQRAPFASRDFMADDGAELPPRDYPRGKGGGYYCEECPHSPLPPVNFGGNVVL